MPLTHGTLLDRLFGYAGTFWDGQAMAVVITGQLLPTSTPPTVQQTSNGTSGTELQSRVACQITVKSSSPDFMLSVESGRGQWLSEISKGALSEGLSSQSMSLASASSHIHAAVAPLKAAYAVAKSTSLEDSGIVSEEASELSVFEDILAQEWRRLQMVSA